MSLSRLSAASDVTTRKRQQGTAIRYNAMRSISSIPGGAIPTSDLYDIGHTVARYNDQREQCTACSNEDVSFELNAHTIVVGGTVVNLTIPPGNPTNLVATTLGLGIIQFTFSPPVTGAPMSYTYIYTDGISQATTIGSILHPTTTFTLTNAIPSNPYTLILRAVNSGGPSSGIILTGVVSNVPNPPVLGTYSVGDGTITISLSGPQIDGGAPIDRYRSSTAIGGPYTDINQTAGPFIVAGLTNGTSYTIYIEARNINGFSTASSVGPATPSIISNVTFTRAAGYSFNVSWTINAILPLTGVNGQTYLTNNTAGVTYLTNSSARVLNFSTFNNNNPLTYVTLTATNANGTSTVTTTNPFTYATDVPYGLTNVTTTAVKNGALIQWTTNLNTTNPLYNPISEFQYSIDGNAPVTVSYPATSVFIPFATDNYYTVTIWATNSIGISAVSTISAIRAPNINVTVPTPGTPNIAISYNPSNAFLLILSGSSVTSHTLYMKWPTVGANAVRVFLNDGVTSIPVTTGQTGSPLIGFTYLYSWTSGATEFLIYMDQFPVNAEYGAF